jgi:hypothetical protein
MALSLAACGGGSATPATGDGAEAGTLDLPPSPQPPRLTVDVTSYQLVTSERVGRTDFLYTYRVNIANAGGEANNVRATVSSSSASTVVTDASVDFGDVPETSTVTSLDTFQIQQNRTVPFDPSALSWSVEFGTPSGPTVATVTVLASSPQLPSDQTGGSTVQISALVKAADDTPLPDVPVTFSATSGSLAVIQPRTDSSGLAIAELSNGTDPTNRAITVQARAGAITESVVVNVVGTTVTVAGPSALAPGQSGTYAVATRDATGTGIPGVLVAANSATGNAFSAASLTTDSEGNATFQLTVTQPGNDTLSITALGQTATQGIAVSSDVLVFTDPPAGTEIALGASRNLTVRWTRDGVPQVGRLINFASTRGNLSASSARTDATGAATVSISSITSGLAQVWADAGEGGTTTLGIEFVALTPASVELEANPLSVEIVGEVRLLARVRDAMGNPVKNRVVQFVIQEDATGGIVSPGSAVTDTRGEARAVYTAGSVASAVNGVQIRAVDQGTGIFREVTLTVTQPQLFIALGTGNTLLRIGTAVYAREWVIRVTDGQGNGVADQRVQTTVRSRNYRKGQLEFIDPIWRYAGDGSPLACPDEDSNQDGILDPAEDLNGSGLLEAGNVAAAAAVPESAPASAACSTFGPGGAVVDVVTNEQGSARVCVFYPSNYALWVDVDITAKSALSGVEFSRSALYTLDALLDDLDDPQVSPPNLFSPFGPAQVPDGAGGTRPATCATP